MADCLSKRSSCCTLRSSARCDLVAPPTVPLKMKQYGDRVFSSSVAAPKLWNGPPQKIRSAPSTDSFNDTSTSIAGRKSKLALVMGSTGQVYCFAPLCSFVSRQRRIWLPRTLLMSLVQATIISFTKNPKAAFQTIKIILHDHPGPTHAVVMIFLVPWNVAGLWVGFHKTRKQRISSSTNDDGWHNCIPNTPCPYK